MVHPDATKGITRWEWRDGTRGAPTFRLSTLADSTQSLNGGREELPHLPEARLVPKSPS